MTKRWVYLTVLLLTGLGAVLSKTGFGAGKGENQRRTPHAARRTVLVAVPVTDLRSEPEAYLLLSGERDPKQETQLLYGEPLIVRGELEGWWQVEAPWQREWSHAEEWQGYPGWVKKEHTVPQLETWPEPTAVVASRVATLEIMAPGGSRAEVPLSMGTRLVAQEVRGERLAAVRTVDGKTGRIREADLLWLAERPKGRDLRGCVIRRASELIGSPYLWGGLSVPLSDYKETITSVDCSGLVHLAYRACGQEVPRDAQEQHMEASEVHPTDLAPGDLLFLGKARDPEVMTHVAIYAGGEEIIEAPSTGFPVRRITLQEKIGKTFRQVRPWGIVGDAVTHFGRLIPADE